MGKKLHSTYNMNLSFVTARKFVSIVVHKTILYAAFSRLLIRMGFRNKTTRCFFFFEDEERSGISAYAMVQTTFLLSSQSYVCSRAVHMFGANRPNM